LYSTTNGTPQSSILLLPTATAGINLSANEIYFYYSNGSNQAWLSLEDGNTHPDVALAPDSSFIVRHPPNTADTQLVLVGNVPMSAQSVIISTLAANTPQDNIIALPLPVSVTLANSGLQNVIASTSNGSPVDELLVFDPTAVAQNKSPTNIYFYYSNGSTHAWLSLFDGNTHDSDTVFQPGYGYILRRAGHAVPGSVVWTYTPPYLNQTN
jgi:uncharacterized protein (TIGR02597 family)